MNKNIGISICIPLFNWDIRTLVKEISKQAEKISLQYEILIIDDHSEKYINENEEISLLKNVIFKRLEENVGRSKCRNLLAENAKYENILIFDCDTAICNETFLENYINNYDKDIVVGGCAYKEKPTDSKKILRWKYGKEREEKNAKQRILENSKIFSTYNFMIKRQLFIDNKFDEQIKGYGHEDTLFALNISYKGYTPTHIDNPLFHLGLDASDIFLQKTENSTINLKKLYNTSKSKKELEKQIKLLKYYKIFNFMPLKFVYNTTYKLFNDLILKNLKSDSPNILLFDFYKLRLMLK